MEVDKDAVAAVAPVARKLNLSNKGFSELAGAYAEHILPRLTQDFEKSVQASATETRSLWEADARTAVAKDGLLGEDGSIVPLVNKAGEKLSFDGKPLKEVQATAARALDLIAPTGFREFLNETGLGVHPMMIAFAYQAGKTISEDRSFEPSGGDVPRAKSREEKYYG